MKKTMIIMMATCLALALAADGAQAGLLSLFKKGKDQQKDEVQAPRYDRYPTMNFYVGTLTRSGWTDWRIGENELVIPAEQASAAGGQSVALREGSQAIVMGAPVGDRIIAQRVRILEPQWAAPPADNQEDIRWSAADPTVGEGTGPN